MVRIESLNVLGNKLTQGSDTSFLSTILVSLSDTLQGEHRTQTHTGSRLESGILRRKQTTILEVRTEVFATRFPAFDTSW